LKRATRERSSFPSLISMPRAARQCCPLPEIEAPSAGEVRNERPRERPPGALHPLADGRSCCTCSSMFEKLRLDRSSAPLSRAFPGRVRFHDFCRSMFQRALPRTNRTSRTSGIRGRDGCRFRSIVAFRSTATAEGTRGQGPRITEPRRSLPGLLPRVTSPQPRSPQTPRVAGIVHHPARSWRGGRTKPPAPRTLARRERREGRATSDFREEIRRSPTRGAFRRKAVRERGVTFRSAGAGSIGRSSAFFTAGRPREGRSRGARKLGLR
jgi:hypothetical protein